MAAVRSDILPRSKLPPARSCRVIFRDSGRGGNAGAPARAIAAVTHAAHALSWIRGPKAVASSSPFERMRESLEITGLIRFFEPRLFSASAVRNGKPAPDLFLLAAARSQVDPADCIVVEDSVPGIAAAAAAGMTPIGFVGGNSKPGRLAYELVAAGARTVIGDLRALKSTIAELRGW